MYDNSIMIFKCLSDKSRLRIINNLLKEPMYVELLAERLGLTPSTVSFHMKKLESCNLVTSHKDQYYVIYQVNTEILNGTLLSLIQSGNVNTEEQELRQIEYKNKILSTFIKDGKLISIPVQRKKRRVILEEILKCFEKNTDYPEKEINIIISDFHEDFCTIRREMIMEGMFTRDKGIYRRTDYKPQF
ncbi:MAG: metalloregulator ArsR/SmtB family transcription factor [Eubacteriales bacterium]